MIHKLQSSSNYRLQVAAEDAHHCEGYLADIYIKSRAYIIIITIIFTMINSVFLLKEATLADDLAVYNTYSKVTTMFLLYLWRKKSKKRLVDRSRALFSASVSSALFPCVYFLSSSGSYGRNSLTGCVCNCTIQPAELTCTHHRFAGSFLGPILDISTNSSIRLK